MKVKIYLLGNPTLSTCQSTTSIIEYKNITLSELLAKHKYDLKYAEVIQLDNTILRSSSFWHTQKNSREL